MEHSERLRFETLYQQHLTALKLQGKRPKTIDAYARAVRRLRDHFDCCPDAVSPAQLRGYFSALVDSHSWSTVKLDRCGLQFFYAHVLERDWDWVRIVKPPQVRRLPDLLSPAEIGAVLRVTRRLRFRVFFPTAYSLGLRLGETLALEVGDIDAGASRVHVRDGKGGKDRLLPLPGLTLAGLRALWRRHRHRRWLFPAPQLRHAPARSRRRPAPDPGAAGSCQSDHDGALYPAHRDRRRQHPGLPGTVDGDRAAPLAGRATNLSEAIERFAPALLARQGDRLSHEALQALSAMRHCRDAACPHWLADCADCATQAAGPHSCGHRSCPHCQHGTGEAWRQRQLQRLLPVDYFPITFTVPAPLRALARRHPRRVYDALLRCAWATVAQFGRNDPRLAVDLGATAVLHTHSRTRDYHPHVHLLVPAGGVNRTSGLWRSTGRYLFKAGHLARVFRAKLLAALRAAQLPLPADLPDTWVADCTRVGRGEQAPGYLARYLYRGVLSERDLLDGHDGQVRFRYRDSGTGQTRIRRLDGADFLWLLLQHVLPKGFHRVREFGLLHPKRKPLLARVQCLLQVRLPGVMAPTRAGLRCPVCGAPMRMIATRLSPSQARERLRRNEARRSAIM